VWNVQKSTLGCSRPDWIFQALTNLSHSVCVECTEEYTRVQQTRLDISSHFRTLVARRRTSFYILFPLAVQRWEDRLRYATVQNGTNQTFVHYKTLGLRHIGDTRATRGVAKDKEGQKHENREIIAIWRKRRGGQHKAVRKLFSLQTWEEKKTTPNKQIELNWIW